MSGPFADHMAARWSGRPVPGDGPAAGRTDLELPDHVAEDGERPQRRAGLSQGLRTPFPARSPGHPLDADQSAVLNARLGSDFSHVRTHSDAAAQQAARDVGATAFTVGRHVVLGSDAPPLRSADGWRLLGHELTHVVQQSSGAGAPPGPAQEDEAQAVAPVVGSGGRAAVHTRSQVGLAAQARPGALAQGQFTGRDSEHWDVTTTSYAEIRARIVRIMRSPGGQAAQGRRDFSANPASARAMLYGTHFRNDDERVSYALGVFEATIATGGDGIDRDVLFRMLLDYEVEMQRRQVDVVVHTPPTRSERQRITAVHAEHERRTYEAYLAEVQRLQEEADRRTVAHGGYSGAATLGPYEYYVGQPVKGLAESFLQADTRRMISIMIDFVPVVGQLKAVAEAIVGRDLITGEQLPTWARGLNLLLAVIPEAKGIFSGGSEGMRTLARVAAESGQPAEEVYEATKLASRLTEDEVKAAQEMAVAGKTTPAQRELAAKLVDRPAASAAEALRTPEDEFGDFMRMLEGEGAGEFGAVGEPISMQPHGGASRAREMLEVTGEQQSMHGLPRSVGRHMPGYDPEAALTTLGEREAHTAMDQPWKDAFQSMRRQGRTTASAQEIYDAVADSIQRAPSLSQDLKNTLKQRLHDEMFVEYGLTSGQQMTLPYRNIKPRP